MLRRSSKISIVKAAWWTLTGSARCLAMASLGRLTPEYGDEKLIQWWQRKLLGEAGVTLTTEGAERLDPKKPWLLMANHTSSLDIPVMFAAAAPLRVRFVAKIQVAELPVFGPALRKLDFIFIDRSRGAKAIRQLEEARKVLETGVSVAIYPEGTRSRTGELLDFKNGGFFLAVQLGIPIVPVYIDGAADVLPADSFDITYDREVKVRFGEPISTEGCGIRDVRRLRDETRDAMLALREGAARIDQAA
jgi:1-acyl-sn-glycerol-3-phosphate acyltransferase